MEWIQNPNQYKSIEDAIHDNRRFQVNCGTEKPVEPKFYGHLTLEHNI